MDQLTPFERALLAQFETLARGSAMTGGGADALLWGLVTPD